MTPALQVVRPDGPLHRVGRVAGRLGARAVDVRRAGQHVRQPLRRSRGRVPRALRRRPAPRRVPGDARALPRRPAADRRAGRDRRRPGVPDAPRRRPCRSEWLETRCVGTASADSLHFVDISHSRVARPPPPPARGAAGPLRARRPRRGRHPQAHPARAHAGGLALRLRARRRRSPASATSSRLGDELSNWGIFEGSEPDEILEENEADRARRPGLRRPRWTTLGLTLD